jgi:ABC-2 type transport system permease protein
VTSTIYDLGYQSYAGERHGRWYAIRTLIAFSFRAAFGIGRGEAARRAPVLVTALVMAPALIQVGVASASGMMNFIHYANYLEFTALIVALFVASQAPELIVTDKQNGALSLYLSRPIRATDYAWAKLIALTGAVIVLTLAPQLLLFGARILLSKTPWPTLKQESPKLIPIVVGSLLISLYFASVALALSAFAVKRAFASAAVIAFFLLTPALSEMTRSIATGALRRWAVLANPAILVSGFSTWLFEIEARRRSIIAKADLPGQAYFWVMLTICVVATMILMSRYRKNAS